MIGGDVVFVRAEWHAGGGGSEGVSHDVSCGLWSQGRNNSCPKENY